MPCLQAFHWSCVHKAIWICFDDVCQWQLFVLLGLCRACVLRKGMFVIAEFCEFCCVQVVKFAVPVYYGSCYQCEKVPQHQVVKAVQSKKLHISLTADAKSATSQPGLN